MDWRKIGMFIGIVILITGFAIYAGRVYPIDLSNGSDGALAGETITWLIISMVYIGMSFAIKQSLGNTVSGALMLSGVIMLISAITINFYLFSDAQKLGLYGLGSITLIYLAMRYLKK